MDQRKKEEIEPYFFQNIYLITTYRCNWACPFCLFRFNNEHETDIVTYTKRLEYAINDSHKKVYIKITGGEPFIYPELLEEIIYTANKYKDKVYKIGIGSNGSIVVPKFFNDLGIRTHIFLSRHDFKKRMSVKDLKVNINNYLIDFRVNCNLIRGGIDSVEKIKKFIGLMPEFTHFCFRELTAVNADVNFLYNKEIYKYIEYYQRHLIRISDIENDLDKDFIFSRNTGNAYDTNHWYWYKEKFSVKFRSINEVALIKFNDENSGIDEYVVHPDGTLTGCWDRDRKIIIKGGI